MARAPEDAPAAPQVSQVIEIYDDGSVTVAHAAALLGCTREAINNHIRDGAPAVFRGKAGRSSRIRLSDYVGWKLDQLELSLITRDGEDEDEDGESYNEKREKARRAKYAADITEMTARERQRELVTIDAAAAVYEADRAGIRAALSNIPGRLSTRLATLSDPREIRGYLKREIEDVLRALCDSETLAQRASDVTVDGIAADDDDA